MKNSLLLALGVASLAIGCRQDMHDQPRFEPMEVNDFFADGRASRPNVSGTVARGELRADAHFYEGKVNGELAAALPFPLTREIVERGQQRYDIYCSPCHGRVGDGKGTVAQRGFEDPPPTSYHIERLRSAPLGHFYDVITNGSGRMLSFNDRVKPRDRWAIASYIRALQISQAVSMDELPQAVVAELGAEGIR